LTILDEETEYNWRPDPNARRLAADRDVTLTIDEAMRRLLITLGDVAGIGPEVLVRAWPAAELHELCRPVVIGDIGCITRTIAALGAPVRIVMIDDPRTADPRPDVMPIIQGTPVDLSELPLGQVSAAAGQAAYDFLCLAIDRTLAKDADGIVTLPLHKEGLRAAGLHYPGHTEILAERTGTPNFAMMLWHNGLGVTHVTLHMALRDVFQHLTPNTVLAKIELTATMVARLKGSPPRIGVCALNPHAGDSGLFGDEERTIIAPAVARARERGIDVTGPWASDTLFIRAQRGEFDGIVAMYHDQGHIALKLLADFRAVNVSLGLPIVRTSVAHGTAYDIVGKGQADPQGLIEAVRVAARLCG
jgi:4-hydroxythreonine-4-phosphate dehydrogenase